MTLVHQASGSFTFLSDSEGSSAGAGVAVPLGTSSTTSTTNAVAVHVTSGVSYAWSITIYQPGADNPPKGGIHRLDGTGTDVFIGVGTGTQTFTGTFVAAATEDLWVYAFTGADGHVPHANPVDWSIDGPGYPYDPSLTPGVWHDFDDDGFTDGTTSGSEVGYLTMEFPEGGASGLSDNITTDTISIDIDQGGTPEVTGGSGTDTCTIVVKNTTGKYSPDNASSVVYGKVKPGKRVWIGVNADGTLTGTGQTIYGLFAGVVREVAPLPSGAGIAATAEIICDGILQSYVTPVRVADSLSRSQYSYRVAVLDAIAESATRRDLAVEPDPLPLSSADSTSALAVLDDLNQVNGTRHFIAADSAKDTWYKYTTRNRHYKNGAAADASIVASTDHLTTIDGWRYNNDSIINSARASIEPIDFPPSPSTVWEYATVPFTVAGNLVIWANFDDYVANPTLTIVSSGAVTSSITTFGHSAKIELYSASASVSVLTVEGSQVIRRQGVSVVADDIPSQAAYGPKAKDLSGDLIGAEASAHGIVDHLVWRYGARPLKRPTISAVNWLPYLFSLHLYDQISVTVASVSASAVKFEIVGRHLSCDLAASASVLNWQGKFTLAESRIQGTQTWFTLDSSVLDGPDLLAY